MVETRSNEDLTLELFRRYGEGLEATVSAIEDLFAPNCVWTNSGGAPPTRSPEEAVTMMRQFHQMSGLWATRIDVTHIATQGDLVFTERMDYAVREDGTEFIELPVAGVLEWKDGKLESWREYFDPTEVLASVQEA